MTAQEQLDAGDPNRRGKKWLKARAKAEAQGKTLRQGEKKARPVTPPASQQNVVAISQQSQQNVVAPLMPSHLIPEAREVWNSLVPQLVAANAVRAIDGHLLGAYCQYIGRALKAEKQLAKYKTTHTRTSNGSLIPRPELKFIDECYANAERVYKTLGLKPQTRRAGGTNPEPAAPPQQQEQPIPQEDAKPNKNAWILQPRKHAGR